MNVEVGQRVLLNTPDNVILDGERAVVAALADWGAHVHTSVGSGYFRALHSEMIPIEETNAVTQSLSTNGHNQESIAVSITIKETVTIKASETYTAMVNSSPQSYTGDVCSFCQGSRMVRSGPCAKCLDCGESGGCN